MDPVLYVQYKLLKLEVFLTTFITRDEFGVQIGKLRISPASIVKARGDEIPETQLDNFYKVRIFSLWFIYPKN